MSTEEERRRLGSRPSGTHPAVVGLRKKLASIEDNELAQLSEMDKELQAYVKEVSSHPPPPPSK